MRDSVAKASREAVERNYGVGRGNADGRNKPGLRLKARQRAHERLVAAPVTGDKWRKRTTRPGSLSLRRG